MKYLIFILVLALASCGSTQVRETTPCPVCQDMKQFLPEIKMALDLKAKDVTWQFLESSEEGDGFVLKYRGQTKSGGVLYVEVPIAKDKIKVTADCPTPTWAWVSLGGNGVTVLTIVLYLLSL